LSFSSGDVSQCLPLQSSGSRTRSAFNNNTKEGRLDGNLTGRREPLVLLLSAEAPTSQGASKEGATCFLQRIKEADDRPKTQLANIATENASASNDQPGSISTIQLDGYHGDLATTLGVSNGEKVVSKMVGCTIGGSSPVDVSGQSRDSALPVGQMGW